MIKVLASGSKGNCYIIQAEEEILLLECGIKWKDILKGLNFNLSNVVGCLITHEHRDHAASMKNLTDNTIKVFTPEEVLLKNNLQTNRKSNPVEVNTNFKIGNFNILAFENNHTNTDGTECKCFGYLIQHPKVGKILFSTDTYYIKYKFKDVDYILVECNYSEEFLSDDLDSHEKRILKSHMSLETLKDFLIATDLSRTKQIVLVHISNDYGNKEFFKNEIEKLTGIPTYAADPGLILRR